MRPLRGLVVRHGVVECENGLVVTNGVPRTLKRNDPVLVYYDLTRGRAVRVELEGTVVETPYEESFRMPDNAEDPASDYWESGAL